MKKLITLVSFCLLILITKANPLSGTYAIPGTYPTGFATIASAVDSLNMYGINGAVTFNIGAGIAYTETLNNAINMGSATLNATTSASNTITFQKDATAIGNPLITAYAGSTFGGSPTGVGDGMWNFMGADYITINGIDFIDPTSNNTATKQMEWAIGLFKLNSTAPIDGVQHCIIENCTITLQHTNSASIGIKMDNRVINSTTAITPLSTSDANSYNKFYSNTIRNVGSCIYMRGYNSGNTNTSLWDTNNDVGGSSTSTGNQFLSYGNSSSTNAYAVYAADQINGNYSFNTIDNYNGGLYGGVSAASNNIYGIYSYNTSIMPDVLMNTTASNNNVLLTFGGTGNSYGVYVYYNAGNVNINNNTVQWATPATSSGSCYGIYYYWNNDTSVAAPNTISNCNNNIVGNCNLANSSGAVYGVYHYGISNKTVNFSGNQFVNVTRNATSIGSTYGMYVNYSSHYDSIGYTTNIFNNVVNNISVSATTTNATIYGIYGASGNYNLNVYNNTVSNLTNNSTTGNTYGIYGFYYGTQINFHNNSISNLLNNSTTGGGNIYGVYYYYNDALNSNFYNNTISGLTNLVASGNVYGVYEYYGGVINAYKNKITDLNVLGNSSCQAIGVMQYGYTGAHSTPLNNWYNNYIGSFSSPSSTNALAQIGFYSSGASGSIVNPKLSFNTIYLTGVNANSTFGSVCVYINAGFPITTLRNNLLVNLCNNTNGSPTGKIVALQNYTSLANYDSSSNNNLFYAGVPSASHLIYADGTNNYQTLTAFQASANPRETNSKSQSVNFLSTTVGNANYLHINPSIASLTESGGINIAGITDDFDGDIRFGNAGYVGTGSAPDIGADEFNGLTTNCNTTFDTIAQTICSNQPYLFNGHSLNVTGVYYDTLSNYKGCDSIVTLNLVVKQASSSSFNHSICSGQQYLFNNNNLAAAGIYYDTLTNYMGCDSIITLNITVNPLPTASFTATYRSCWHSDSTADVVYTGSPVSSYAWIFPNGSPSTSTIANPTVSYASGGTHQVSLIVTDANSCSATLNDTVVFSANCVWPGDANNDLVADNLDIFPIGLMNGTTGPFRQNASIVWVDQPALSFNTTIPSTSTDAKYADCNGDGVIDGNDTTAIIQNYGLTHLRHKAGTQNLLTMSIGPDTLYQNTTATILVGLGSSTVPMDSIYGVAFSFHTDPTAIDTNSIQINTQSSWLFANSTDHFHLYKLDKSGTIAHVGLVRNDHIGKSGFGNFVTISIDIITGNIVGREDANFNHQYQLHCSIDDISILKLDGSILNAAVSADSSLILYNKNVGINSINKLNLTHSLIPNPTNNFVSLQLNGYNWNEEKKIILMDATGKIVLNQNFTTNQKIIDLSNFSSGIYLAKIITTEGVFESKLIKQ